MDTVSRRLLKELHDLCENPDILELRLVGGDDLLNWRALLRGATGTAYEGGVFELRITVPQSYPIHPPTIKFVTTICHPNVHFKSGEICLDILKTAWSPAWTLQSTLLAISLLLAHPEPSSPLNCDAANLLRCGDIDGYNSLVRMYTELYAMDHVSSDEDEVEGMLESAVLVEQQESSFVSVDGHSRMLIDDHASGEFFQTTKMQLKTTAQFSTGNDAYVCNPVGHHVTLRDFNVDHGSLHL